MVSNCNQKDSLEPREVFKTTWRKYFFERTDPSTSHHYATICLKQAGILHVSFTCINKLFTYGDRGWLTSTSLKGDAIVVLAGESVDIHIATSNRLKAEHRLVLSFQPEGGEPSFWINLMDYTLFNKTTVKKR